MHRNFGLSPLYSNSHLNMANKELNRLKVILAEKKKTNKWLGVSFPRKS